MRLPTRWRDRLTSPLSFDATQDVTILNPGLNVEWAFLRAAVAGQDPDRLRALSAKVRWPVLLDLAERHGVNTLLYRALSTAENLAPAPDISVLAHLYQTNLHKTMLMARELIHLVDHLARHGIDVLPYKGLALAETVYGDMAQRQMGDIDLLIHSRDLVRLQGAVRELGYVPHSPLSPGAQRASLKSGYECVFDGRAGRNLLEVQWAILPRFYAVDFDQDDIFRRAVSVKIAGHSLRTPCLEDLFLILSVHAAKHVWGRLLWLSDLARIVAMPQLDWPRISEQATKLGILRILRVSLLLTMRLLYADIPAAADRSLPPDSEAEALASEIETLIASPTELDVESAAYFRLMLRLREKGRTRWRFLTRLALTPGPGEWEAIHLPETLFPLYHLVRFGRLSGKFFGK